MTDPFARTWSIPPYRALRSPMLPGGSATVLVARSGGRIAFGSIVSALDAVALVLAILALVALTLLVVMIPVRRRARRDEAELAQQLGPGLRRIATVRGLGLKSRGRGQVRGNGTLALSVDELRFRQWIPQREVRIPLANVTHVGTERWWLGKTVGRRLLCVRWRREDGSEDAMAWEVRDLDSWLADLRA